jgi:molybdopterin synthase catalytic subunit
VHHVAIYHRLGEVPPTEASVVIAVSSEHRKESLEAVTFAIDALVPIR